MTTRKLGLKPGDPTRPAVKLGPALTGIVPAHPAGADNASRITDWSMLANDQYGDCGPCGLEHQRMQVTRYLTDTPYTPTVDDTLAFYKLCDPDFDPATGTGDNGVVLQDMIHIAAAHGVGGVKPVCFARVDHTNIDEIRAAIAVFGSVLFGVDLQTAQQTQTDHGGPWDYRPSGEWGGHCVLAVSYTSATTGTDIGVVSWGEVIGCTDAFLRHQLAEAWVVVWPEHLGSTEFLTGVDVATLAADYQAVTGRPFPVPVPPAPEPPQPTPSPGPVADPDATFAAALHHNGWVNAHHTGEAARVAAAGREWLATKGL